VFVRVKIQIPLPALYSFSDYGEIWCRLLLVSLAYVCAPLNSFLRIFAIQLLSPVVMNSIIPFASLTSFLSSLIKQFNVSAYSKILVAAALWSSSFSSCKHELSERKLMVLFRQFEHIWATVVHSFSCRGPVSNHWFFWLEQWTKEDAAVVWRRCVFHEFTLDQFSFLMNIIARIWVVYVGARNWAAYSVGYEMRGWLKVVSMQGFWRGIWGLLHDCRPECTQSLEGNDKDLRRDCCGLNWYSQVLMLRGN
jgi:hypothetical protein